MADIDQQVDAYADALDAEYEKYLAILEAKDNPRDFRYKTGYGNNAYTGGAAYIDSGSLDIQFGIMSGNSAKDSAIYNLGTLKLGDVYFTKNDSDITSYIVSNAGNMIIYGDAYFDDCETVYLFSYYERLERMGIDTSTVSTADSFCYIEMANDTFTHTPDTFRSDLEGKARLFISFRRFG